MCAHYSWGVIAQLTELGNTHMYTKTSIYPYLTFFLYLFTCVYTVKREFMLMSRTLTRRNKFII